MKVLPCPFCGSTNISYSSKTTGRKKMQRHNVMYCENCRCYGPRLLVTLAKDESYKNIKDEKYINMAINAWNKRS